MAEILVGYARCSTTSQDVRAQLSALKKLGVTDEHLHTDRGRTGRNRERSGLTAALGAVRDGDVLVVTKLDRLGRSARDLHDIAARRWRCGRCAQQRCGCPSVTGSGRWSSPHGNA